MRLVLSTTHASFLSNYQSVISQNLAPHLSYLLSPFQNAIPQYQNPHSVSVVEPRPTGRGATAAAWCHSHQSTSSPSSSSNALNNTPITSGKLPEFLEEYDPGPTPTNLPSLYPTPRRDANGIWTIMLTPPQDSTSRTEFL